MGLDQNAWLKDKEGKEVGEFYWRKHSRLQEFMQKLWMEKTGETDEGKFNCQELVLSVEDLDKLKESVSKGYADHFCEGGFFWGHQYQESQAEYYKEQDIEFADGARRCIERGGSVIYECWY